MKTFKISPNYLRHFLDISPFYYSEELYPELIVLNLANRSSVRRWAHEYLRPHFLGFPIARQIRIKESFRYGLNFWPDDTLQHCAEEWLDPTGQTPIRQRCEEIWNDLFDGEYFGIDNPAAYQIVTTPPGDPFGHIVD